MSRRHPDGEPRICFDLDGTLTHGPWPTLSANDEMFALAHRLRAKGVEIAVLTGRPPEDEAKVTAWLESEGLIPDRIVFGKPPADLYLDDMGLLVTPRLAEVLWHFVDAGARWSESLVSGEMDGPYVQEAFASAENEERVLFTEPMEVVIPFTSGMDSLVLWLAAREEGLPYRLVYFDFGQAYAALEVRQAKVLLEGEPLQVISRHLPFIEHQHILSGRNAVLLLEAAALVNGWGEVHFGVLGGESPVSGGDKSHRFMADTQALITLLGHDVRLCSPLAVLDKPDLIAWLDRRDELWRVRYSKSCFDPEKLQCGSCIACFRKYAALLLNECDPVPYFPDGVDFDDVVRRYELRLKQMDQGKSEVSYTRQRRSDLETVIDDWKSIRHVA